MGAAVASVGIEQFVDQPGGFELAELLHTLAEALLGNVINLVLVEAVLVDEFQDQILLLVGTLPATVVVDVGDGSGCGCIGTVAVLHPIRAGRDESRAEHLLVHIGLEELVEACGLGGDVVGGAQLGFHRDGELVTTEAGEAKAFRIIGDEFDGHNGWGWLFVVDG